MGLNLSQDWPVYILLGVVIFFFIYVVIHSWRQEKKDKEEKDKNAVK